MKLKNALGPLKEIYKKEDVYEIIVNSYDDVYYEQREKIVEENKLFKSSDEVESVINDLMNFANIKKQDGVYNYDFTLDDKTRINVVLPPMSMNGPTFNILKIP